MFDIGFTELLLCLVVALVVIGPEQLPGTVRTVALWIGRIKRSLVETRSEIERQIGADEIRRQLHNEEIMRNIEATRAQLEASLREHGVLDDEQYKNAQNGYQEGSNQERPSYGPPEELPDHSHSDQNPQQHEQTASDSSANAGQSEGSTDAPTSSHSTSR